MKYNIKILFCQYIAVMSFLAFPALGFAQEYVGPRIQNPPPQYCCKFPFPENPYAYATTDSCNRNGGSVVEDSLCRVKPPVAAPAAPKPVTPAPVPVADPANADLRKLIVLAAKDVRLNLEDIKDGDKSVKGVPDVNKEGQAMHAAWLQMKAEMEKQDLLLKNFWKGPLPEDPFLRQIEISRRSDLVERGMAELAKNSAAMAAATEKFRGTFKVIIGASAAEKAKLEGLQKKANEGALNLQSQINAMQRARFLGLWYYRPFMLLPMPPITATVP